MLGHKSCHVELVFSIELNFPCTIPLLDLLLALDGLAHVLMLLKVHKIVHLVRPGKTRDDILFMFLHTLDQVRGHTDIQRPVSPTRENVDCRLFCHGINTHGFPRPA